MGPLGRLATRGPHVKYYNRIDYTTDLGEAIFINSNLIFVDPGHVKLYSVVPEGEGWSTEDTRLVASQTFGTPLLSKIYGIMCRQRKRLNCCYSGRSYLRKDLKRT